MSECLFYKTEPIFFGWNFLKMFYQLDWYLVHEILGYQIDWVCLILRHVSRLWYRPLNLMVLNLVFWSVWRACGDIFKTFSHLVFRILKITSFALRNPWLHDLVILIRLSETRILVIVNLALLLELLTLLLDLLSGCLLLAFHSLIEQFSQSEVELPIISVCNLPNFSLRNYFSLYKWS